jgi:hypothetical protein
MRSALAAGRARAWMHGRLWVNDPDCVLVRPEVERPEPWAEYVETLRGLAVSSDPLSRLDAAHLERTRELMVTADLAPVHWDAWTGPDQGSIHRAPASPSMPGRSHGTRSATIRPLSKVRRRVTSRNSPFSTPSSDSQGAIAVT